MSRSAINVQQYGALGDGVTDDTAAIQAAWNAATTGPRALYFPAVSPGKFYNIAGHINATNFNASAYPPSRGQGMTVYGDGDGSAIGVGASTGNWWDLTGSQGVTFRDLSIQGVGANIPDDLFLWAATATSAAGRPYYLGFDRVNVKANTKCSHLFAYSTAGLSMRDCVWEQDYNGAVNSDPSKLTSVVRLDGLNSWGISSAFQTIASGAFGTERIDFSNCNFIEFCAGIYPSQSNDVGLSLINAVEVTINGGSVKTQGQADVLLWSNCEAVQLNGTSFDTPSSIQPEHIMRIGGGVNNTIGLFNPWMTVAASGTLIAIDPPAIAGAPAGTWHLTLLSPNPGGGGANMIGVTGGATAPVTNPFLLYPNIDCFSMGIAACGNIDGGILISPAVVTLPAGCTDTSHHF